MLGCILVQTWYGPSFLPCLQLCTYSIAACTLLLNYFPPLCACSFTGSIKIFLSMTPVDGGTSLRVRTWMCPRVARSPLLRCVAFLLTGISASQLNADVDILENKIRLRRPLVQPFDGPYNRTNAWLKQFYSASSPAAGHIGCDAYKNDW